MAWYAINQGQNGNSSQLDGPMDIFFSFACYGIPMIIAECIFWAKRQKVAAKIWAVSTLTVSGALITLIGIAAAIFMMWLPRMSLVV